MHILYHEAIGRLSNTNLDDGNDVLDSMETAITVLPAASPDNCLASVLASWLPADDDAPPRVTDELAVASLSVLLNVAAKHSAKLLNRRRPLVNEALKSTTNEDAKWLPCLPIGGVRYFVGSASNKFLAVPILSLIHI